VLPAYTYHTYRTMIGCVLTVQRTRGKRRAGSVRSSADVLNCAMLEMRCAHFAEAGGGAGGTLAKLLPGVSGNWRTACGGRFILDDVGDIFGGTISSLSRGSFHDSAHPLATGACISSLWNFSIPFLFSVLHLLGVVRRPIKTMASWTSEQRTMRGIDGRHVVG